MTQLPMTLQDERDFRKVEIRLVALSEEYTHTVDKVARNQIQAEYRRLHRVWLKLKAEAKA